MKDNRQNFLAVDLGATSGRTVLGTYDGTRVEMTEWTRFKNPQIPFNNSIRWDIMHLYNEVLLALKKVADEGIELTSIGIDTWGCDFTLFGKNGGVLGQPRCYRDPYTDGAIERFEQKMSKEELYARTGIQFMPFNSLFQLDTLKTKGCTALNASSRCLFMPDALRYMLTGMAETEYTVASTSQMINPKTRDFDPEILKALGVERAFFGPLVQPGYHKWHLSKQVQEYTGLGEVPVVAVAGHDTASAVAAVPAKDENYAYLSCGTWSLLGIESPEPIINEDSFRANFTNEGGIFGTTRFLKNICGLWIFERSRAEMKGLPDDVNAINALCEESDYEGIIDPDDPIFAHPASMMAAIREYLTRTGQPLPETNADYLACIFNSLANRYREMLQLLRSFSKHPIDCLHVIGGGSLNKHLMQRTANALRMPVICGPVEGTALGNILMQLVAAGELVVIDDLRAVSRASVQTTMYLPQL